MASSSITTLVALIALLAALASCGRVARSDEPTYTSYRLPTAFKPEHYDLQVLTHLGDERGYVFSGRVLIKVSLFFVRNIPGFFFLTGNIIFMFR